MRRAVFLDRDGVLNEECGFVTRVEDFILRPGVPEALADLGQRGFTRVVVTNQSGVARGLIPLAELDAMHQKLRSETDDGIDAVYFCPHHPEEGDDPQQCDCRKPEPGMLLAASDDLGIALSESWLVGDAPRDIDAGQRAGCRTICVMGPKMPSPEDWPDAVPQPEAFVESLAEACRLIR